MTAQKILGQERLGLWKWTNWGWGKVWGPDGVGEWGLGEGEPIEDQVFLVLPGDV